MFSNLPQLFAFFFFFFQIGDNSSRLDCVDFQGAEKMETTQSVQIDL